VQRSVKFARYLPEFDWETVVVTGPLEGTELWGPPDKTLSTELSSQHTSVRRVEAPRPDRSTGARARAERWLRLESPFSQWWIEGAYEASREAASEADLIFATMSPFESGIAAARLARETGKPWVADLRDPWALDDWLVYPSALHRRLELRKMRETLSTSAAIVMNTPEATRQLVKSFPELGKRPVATIPNGYDAADFVGAAPGRQDSAFRIVHAGFTHSVSGRRHQRVRLLRQLLGGAASGLEVLTRSHVYLLEAIKRLIAEEPALANVIELHLAGAATGSAEPSGVVQEHGYLPHAETIELLRSADLLFLPMHDLRPGTRARIVPGKTYEYLASGVPILAAVPDGDARDLLTEGGSASLCRPADVDCLAAAVRRHIQRWRAGEAAPSPRPEVLERFERRRLTAELAEVFERVLAGGQGAVSSDSRRVKRRRSPSRSFSLLL
jgi:glycosyltransferase involved in cell wall biosynthesis